MSNTVQLLLPTEDGSVVLDREGTAWQIRHGEYMAVGDDYWRLAPTKLEAMYGPCTVLRDCGQQ